MLSYKLKARKYSRHLRCLLAVLVLSSPSLSAHAEGKFGFWNRLRKPAETQTSEAGAAVVGSKQQVEAVQKQVRKASDVAEISLNHVQATWAKVLKQVAEQSELTLVMDVVPKGFFSRIDKRPHTQGFSTAAKRQFPDCA